MLVFHTVSYDMLDPTGARLGPTLYPKFRNADLIGILLALGNCKNCTMGTHCQRATNREQRWKKWKAWNKPDPGPSSMDSGSGKPFSPVVNAWANVRAMWAI